MDVKLVFKEISSRFLRRRIVEVFEFGDSQIRFQVNICAVCLIISVLKTYKLMFECGLCPSNI